MSPIVEGADLIADGEATIIASSYASGRYGLESTTFASGARPRNDALDNDGRG